MLKKINALLIGCFFVTILGACSLDDIANSVSPQALGLLIYDDHETIDQTIEEFSNKALTQETWQVKMVETSADETIMVIPESAAQLMLANHLWHEVIHNEKANVVYELPKITTDQAVLFTKTDTDKVDIEAIHAFNKGNIVLGNGRKYTDMFVITANEQWESLQAEEKTIGFLHFSKEENPKYKLNQLRDVEAVQLVDVS